MIDNALVAVKFMTDKQLLDQVESLSLVYSNSRSVRMQYLTSKAMDMYANELWVRNRGLEEKLDD